MPDTNERHDTATAKPNGKGEQVRKAFISAPAGVDTKPLREVLGRRGIDSFFADEMDLPGRSLPEVLVEGMAEADLIIAILDTERNNSNVLFELGFAMGQGKRVLVLAPTDDILPGVALTGMPTIRARPQDTERIEFGLNQVLAAPRRKDKPKKTPTKQTHPIGVVADHLLRELTPEINGEHVEQLVWKALVESGITTLSGLKEDSVLAVWSDDLEPWVGNPLVIEIKSNVRGKDQLDQAINQVLRGLGARGATWGLLLYCGTVPASLKARLQGSPVLAISVEEFLRSLKQEGFADVVRRLRNERVHGGA